MQLSLKSLAAGDRLEVLCTDARRLMFDQEENWFRAHAAFDDDYRARVQGALKISGDDIQWNQDAADKVTQAAINFFHRRYDFKARVDLLNAQHAHRDVGLDERDAVPRQQCGLEREDAQRQCKSPPYDSNPPWPPPWLPPPPFPPRGPRSEPPWSFRQILPAASAPPDDIAPLHVQAGLGHDPLQMIHGASSCVRLTNRASASAAAPESIAS